MKKILTLLIFSAFAVPLSAQTQTTQSMPEYTSKGVKVYERGIRLSVPMAKYVFYSTNGTPAYDVYTKGIRLNRIGHCLLWPGVWFASGGLTYIIISSRFRGDLEIGRAILRAMGVAAIVVGAPFIGTGIALRVKGKRMVARAVNMYNDYINSSAGNYFPEISLGVTPGGLGMVYTF